MMLLESADVPAVVQDPQGRAEFEMVMEMIDAIEVIEDDENYVIILDVLFQRIEDKNTASGFPFTFTL